MSPFLWCLFVLQWNMIARVSNAAGVKLSLVSWDNDRLKIKHPKTKTDGEGKKAFPMSLMTNRYCWYICPVLALAVYMSCFNFKKDTDQLFSGDGNGKSAASRYCERMRAFLKRADIQSDLNEYAELLKGSHGVRKGATNHGATAGLVANVLIAVLLRGQWDIGDPLSLHVSMLHLSSRCTPLLSRIWTKQGYNTALGHKGGNERKRLGHIRDL